MSATPGQVGPDKACTSSSSLAKIGLPGPGSESSGRDTHPRDHGRSWQRLASIGASNHEARSSDPRRDRLLPGARGRIRKTWGYGACTAPVRVGELALERRVSQVIGEMPFLWLGVPGPAGPGSDRKLIETGAIALLSNLDRRAIDPPSRGWLGRDATHVAVKGSGLWNVNHVAEQPRAPFLRLLEEYVCAGSAGNTGLARRSGIGAFGPDRTS